MPSKVDFGKLRNEETLKQDLEESHLNPISTDAVGQFWNTVFPFLSETSKGQCNNTNINFLK